MAVSSEVMVARDGVLTIKDAAGTPLAVVPYSDGVSNLGPFSAGDQDILETRARGKLVSLRNVGSRSDMGFSVKVFPTTITDASVLNLLDLMLKQASGAAGASTWPNSDVHTLQCELALTRTTVNGSNNLIIMKYCHLTATLTEGDPSAIDLTAKVFIRGSDEAASVVMS